MRAPDQSDTIGSTLHQIKLYHHKMERGSAAGTNGGRPYIDGGAGVEDTLTTNSYSVSNSRPYIGCLIT